MDGKSQSRLRGIIPFLAAISLAGGPITWTAHTNCQARICESDRARDRAPAAPDKPENHSPDAGASFVSACSAKPADSDSSAVGLVRVASSGVELPAPARWVDSRPSASPASIGLHRSPFQSQAPPRVG